MATRVVTVPTNRPKKYKKRRKPNLKRVCPVCGMEDIKGLQGLASHMGKMHNMNKEQREFAIAQGTKFLTAKTSEGEDSVRIPVLAG